MNTLKWNRIFVTLTCLTLMLVLTFGNVNASPTLQGETDFAAIDAYVTEQMNNLGIPGMALGIVQGDQIVHLQGFGVADSSGRKVTPQTPFHIGSATKSFTALAVVQLVEVGKIDLDAPVQIYLPWFELADKEASAKITVRHLLNQTTGISTKDGNRFWNSQQGLEEIVRGLGNLRLIHPVGSTFEYSNLNYSIAGLIVEKVSGQSYADYVTQHILEPLDMHHSYASPSPALADGLAEGHLYMFGRVFRDEGAMPPVYLPAGGLIASVEDVSHYAVAQLNDGRYGDTTILSQRGISELHAPVIPTMLGGDDHYAMGWRVVTWDGIRMVYHNGDEGRNHSIVMLMPERDLGVVLLANASGFVEVSQADEIAKNVMSMLNSKSPAPVSLPSMVRFLYWAVLLTPFLQILGILLGWRNRRHTGIWPVILTVILNLTVVYFMVGLSQKRITLPSLVVFYPEVGYGLIAISILGIGWSVIYTAMYLRMQRSK